MTKFCCLCNRKHDTAAECGRPAKVAAPDPPSVIEEDRRRRMIQEAMRNQLDEAITTLQRLMTEEPEPPPIPEHPRERCEKPRPPKTEEPVVYLRRSRGGGPSLISRVVEALTGLGGRATADQVAAMVDGVTRKAVATSLAQMHIRKQHVERVGVAEYALIGHVPDSTKPAEAETGHHPRLAHVIDKPGGGMWRCTKCHRRAFVRGELEAQPCRAEGAR